MTGLLIICTGNYGHFLDPLLKSVEQNFLKDERIDAYIFSDKPVMLKYNRVKVTSFYVPRLKFPYPTLYRYKWFSQYADELISQVLYYIDVDMLIVNEVGSEILPDNKGLVAVRHPGYYRGGWGDYGTSKQSLAYIPIGERKGYYAGGFQGGEREAYLMAAREMADNIEFDEKNKVMATWHDESHWNKYLTGHPFKELTPSYCFPEAGWAMDLPYEKKIIALDKDHKKLRS